MTAWTFRATWPILDPDRTLSQLRVEACATIDQLAADTGARIVGDITWAVDGERLVARAPATPATVPTAAAHHATRGSVMAQAPAIRHLATTEHLTDRQIADRLGCSESAVAKVRGKHRIPPGGGNPYRQVA